MRNSSQGKSIKLKRSIYLLPNLFTTGSLFAGFYAIISATHHNFTNAAIAIFLAMILDALDGRIARLINAESAFGAEYDSLADIVSFGVTPALVIYNANLMHLGKLGWLCAFLYMACVALRLARFNIQTSEKRYFVGLPCPAGAGFMASLVWVCDIYKFNGYYYQIMVAVLTIFVALLMVSNIRFRSFKDIDIKTHVHFKVIILVLLTYIIISWHPAQILFVLSFGYVCSGVLLEFRVWLRKRRNKRKQKNAKSAT
ncbi:MAG: CDP-diacylglycerol--serine O-phosphatidyltransferase [Thiotrichales bacterium]|nr:MAG: CDP-diacylglycerol--serine O-phosphatidyltransferase [Thiotrichales bacterium]